MHPVNRRAFLRGAGAAMALPFIEQLAPAAPGATGKPPLRFGVFTVTGGTVIESWKPKEVGPLGKLPSILRPLEFAKDELLVVSGLSHHGRSEGLNAHEHCALMHLTGAEAVKKVDGKLVSAPSVDQVAARAVGDLSFLPSLEIGLSNHETQYSWRSADARVPYEANPRLVFDRMFRGRTPVVPNWKTRATQQAPVAHAPGSPKKDSIDRSVLDLVREEANDLRRDLGAADRKRLDQYLDGVRSIEKRIDFIEHRQRLEAADAANPGPSKLSLPTNLPKENVPIWQVTNPVHRDPEYHENYTKLMTDLMVFAFQTDTTRVGVFACGSDEAKFPGVVTVGYETHCHTLEHQGNAGRVEDADPISREALRQIHVWYTQLFAGMVRRMREIDEGGSSLLDNTLLLYTSYMADGGHGTHDYPAVLVGKAAGTLKTGRHLAFKPRTPVSNLYAEILDRMGAKTTRFGENMTSQHRQYDGKLPGLVQVSPAARVREGPMSGDSTSDTTPDFGALPLEALAPRPVKVDVGARTHPGKVRENNEDNFHVVRFGRYLETVFSSLSADQFPEEADRHGFGFCVADGLGGHAAGEIASRRAIALLVEYGLQTPDWLLGREDALLARMMARTSERFQSVNAAVIAEAQRQQLLGGMGTTLSLAKSLGDNLIVANIGDSRVYLLRDSTLHRLTTDHTVAQERAGIDPGAARFRNVLTRAIGIQPGSGEPDVYRYRLSDGDRLLLCTDGLTDMVDDVAIARELARGDPAEQTCQALVDLALAGGGKDNVTVIVATYRFPNPLEPKSAS